MSSKINWPNFERDDAVVSSEKRIAPKYAIKATLAMYGYEVAPEWKRFCTFGPKDIGTVWEEIGAIRPMKINQLIADMVKEDVDRQARRIITMCFSS